MTAEDLHKTIRRATFQPFRIFRTDGTTFDIRHPELFMLGRRSVIVGITAKPNPTYYDTDTNIDLMHIIRTEDLPAPVPQNGAPS